MLTRIHTSPSIARMSQFTLPSPPPDHLDVDLAPWIASQLDDGLPHKSEDDIQQELLGPRGVPGKPLPVKMAPQRAKKTPRDLDPPHTA